MKKATANMAHRFQPYVVYGTENGVRKAHAKMASHALYSMALDKRKVG